MNLCVLRPLTPGPQGQSSPLRTPHGCLLFQGILPISRGQAPPGSPMVYHSMASGFQIPQGCCLGLSVARIFPALFSSQPRDVPFPVTTYRHWPTLCVPSLIPYLYPSGTPATQWRGPTGSSTIRGPFCAPCTGRYYPVPSFARTCFPFLRGRCASLAKPLAWPRHHTPPRNP